MPDDSPLSRRSVVKSLGAAAGLGLAGAGTVASLPGDGDTATNSTNSTDSDTSTDVELDGTTGWPQYAGNPAKTGVAGDGPASNTVLWEYTEGGEEREYHKPAVVEDTLYVPYSDGEWRYEEESADGIVALTTEGEVKWTYEAPSYTELLTDPAYADGYVFVGGRTSETEGYESDECSIESPEQLALLVGVDAETGEVAQKWTEAGRRFKTPTVADGTVYSIVPTGIQEDGILYAYDIESGEERWTYNADGAGISGYRAPPVAVADGTVYVAEHELAALDAETGERLWENTEVANLKSGRGNAPAVVDGTVYVGGGYGGTLYAISTEDGSIEWTFDLAASMPSSAAVAEGTVYVETAALEDHPTGTYALNADDGTEQWFSEYRNGTADAAPAIVGDQYVYVGTRALSKEDGSIAWEQENSGPSAVAGNRLYYGGPSVGAVGEE